MRLLVLDTSNSTCCSGIYDIDLAGADLDIKELGYKLSLERRTHSEVIMPLTEQVFEEAGLSHDEIDAYAVTVGPGSFTGIRIGISIVKGMAAVTGKDCIPISSTEALMRSVEVLPFEGETFLVASFDARNNRVFAAVFDEQKEVLISEDAYDADDLAGRIINVVPKGARVIICGNGCKTVIASLEKVGAEYMVEDAEGTVILPKGIARSALHAIRTDREKALIGAIKLSPKYCARSQAERFRKPPSFEVRKATTDDVMVINVLEAEGIDHPWMPEAIEDLITSDNKTALVLVETDKNEVVGYIGASVVTDEAELGNLCVSGRYRRLGAGTILLRALKDEAASMGAKTLFLEVRENNYPAIALYEKEGFETVGMRKDYYGQGVNALLMKSEL